MILYYYDVLKINDKIVFRHVSMVTEKIKTVGGREGKGGSQDKLVVKRFVS